MARSLAAASLLITLLLVVAVVPAARAHTDAELDSWRMGWATRAFDPDWSVRHWPTLEGEYVDMSRRHPRWFGLPVPHSHPRAIARAPTPVYAAGVEQWRPLVSRYFAADQVERALRVMACESGGAPNAKSPISSASGLMQHLGKYWASRSAAAGWAGASIFDPEANIAVAAWLQRTGGWGHWVCR